MRSSQAPQIFERVNASQQELEAIRREVEELKKQAKAQVLATSRTQTEEVE